MTTRTRERTVAFRRPFVLKGVGRALPPGDYRVSTDEELIEGLSFPVYRRIATMLFAPTAPDRPDSLEMHAVDAADLEKAEAADRSPV